MEKTKNVVKQSVSNNGKVPSNNRKVIKKRKPMKYRKLFVGTSVLMVLLTLILLFMVIRLNVLGFKILIVLLLAFVLVEGMILCVLNKRFKVGFKIPFFIMAILISGIAVFGIYNVNLFSSFVSKVVSSAVEKEEEYHLYALSSSDYTSIADINKTVLGIFDNKSDTLEEAKKELDKRATFKDQKTYDEIETMLKDGIDKKIDVIYISSSLVELMNENYEELFSHFKLVDTIKIQVKREVSKSEVDVTKEPFLIYVSGNDTYGSIKNVSRSDVNILVAVNPKTRSILLVNTPRDYYVKLHSKKAMDKLTHAGIYGVEESMKTLADLYATNVDFYVNINFSSLIKIVDALGGITVNSKYSFSYDGFTFNKGKNRLDGKAALAFSRFRKGLPQGDISRGENQEAVIEAIVEKISNPSVISKYASILKTIGNSFNTNMSEEDIYKLAKFQLNESPKWSITSQNATGQNAYDVTYSAGRTKLYVMKPDEESVTDVKNKLNEILEEN